MTMNYIDRRDARFPPQLRFYDRMPAGLYVIGRLPDPARKSVAIIGARKCSNYGYGEAKRFGAAMAAAGVQVISGMAGGCDAAGHEGALEGGGTTFAVLGCGVDICYPRSNARIYERIPVQGGGILSEYEPGTEPLAWHFPIRNRIISALADVILVVEARKRSGSLITVEYALEQGKTIFAVPGRNRDQASEGCNKLIADGAMIATSPEDILDALGISSQGSQKPCAEDSQKPHASSARDSCVKRILDFDEKSVYTIAEEAGCSPQEAGALLLELCRAGYAQEILPGYYCRR